MDIRKRDKNKNSISESEFFEEVSNNNLNGKSIYRCGKDNKELLTMSYWIYTLFLLFFLYNYGNFLQYSCELDSDVNERDGLKSILLYFNDTIARQHIRIISSFGRRPTGSVANELITPKYILNYVNEITKKYSNQNNAKLQVTTDEHLSERGSFRLHIRGKYFFSSIYDKIRFIAIRIHDTRHHVNDTAVLINCHYDSFFGGPGASDDLASCAVMLETLHSLLRHQPLLLSDIILLFNGAEENILQASHSFVTEHKWANDVKLVINLEAAGSGGRQIIFQVSQQQPWIVNEIGTVIKQPFATVIGQEIFAANLIPSDTDYRIFRDFGHIPGADLAFITNGYVYHTSYDTDDRIPQACLRHTGVNILNIALHLTNIDLSGDQNSSQSTFSSQRIVFFDFLGFVFISYSEKTAFLLTFVLLLSTVAFISSCVWRRPSGYSKQLFLATISQILWIVSTLLLSALLGFLLHRFGGRMTWFSLRYNILGLFVSPFLCYFLLYQTYVPKILFRIPQTKESADSLRHGCLIIISALTLVLTVFRFLSCYFVAMWLVFFFIHEIILNALKPANFSEVHCNIIHFLMDAVSYSLPMLYYFYLASILYEVFIPILGRSGPTYPDVIISLLTGLVFILPGLLLSGNVHITKRSSNKWLIFLLLQLSISYYILVHSTQLGYPYNQSEVEPRKQRIAINHVNRNIRNSRGEIKSSESGLWISSLDANGMTSVKKELQKVLNEPIKNVFCEILPYCGYPMFYPMARVVDNSIWIPRLGHKLEPLTVLTILDVDHLVSGVINITLQISGPTHSPIYIMSPKSIQIIAWSLGTKSPRPINLDMSGHNDLHHYFIFYGYGDRPHRPLTFWFLALHNHQGQPPNCTIEVAVAALYLLAKTEEMESVVRLMPKWTVPSAIASTYEHAVIDCDRRKGS